MVVRSAPRRNTFRFVLAPRFALAGLDRYEYSLRVNVRIDLNGQPFAYSYGVSRSLVSVTCPSGAVHEYHYYNEPASTQNQYGQVSTVDGPRTDMTDKTYDGHGPRDADRGSERAAHHTERYRARVVEGSLGRRRAHHLRLRRRRAVEEGEQPGRLLPRLHLRRRPPLNRTQRRPGQRDPLHPRCHGQSHQRRGARPGRGASAHSVPRL